MPEIVQEIGAYAGLASVVGLAVLSALYFSQARDVKRLREWAGRAPERVPSPPGQAVQQRVVAQPQRPGQPQPGQPQPGQPRPGAPVVPGQPRPGVPAIPAAAGARPAAATAAAQGTPVAGGNNVGAAAPAQAPGRPGQQVPGQPNPAQQQSQAAASAPTQVVPGKPATPAAQRPGGVPPTLPGAQSPAAGAGARPPVRPTVPPISTAPPAQPPWYRTPRYVVLVIAGVLVIGGGAAFGLTQLGKDDGSTGSSNAAQDGGGGDDKAAPEQTPIKPADVTVAVLNGTTVPGLGRQVGDQLAAKGFRLGNVDNSPDSSQQRAESVVQFAQGHRREAMAVGRRLGIGQREPIDPAVQQLAGDATVVVITGQDQNQTP